MNDKKIIVGIVIAVFAIACIACYMLGRGNNVQSVSDGLSTVDAGLSTAITGQQAVTGKLRDINEGLGRTADEIGVSEVTIIKVSKSLTDSSAILRRDAEIIARDSEIFEKIKASKD